MKKLIALLLAVIMTFSLGTVAFAEGEAAEGEEVTTTAPAEGEEGTEGEESETEEAGDFDWLLDLPFWTVKPALKFAKLALKFAKIYVKIGIIFGFVDKNDIIGQIQDLINSAMNSGGTTEEAPEEAPEEVPEETTTAAAA